MAKKAKTAKAVKPAFSVEVIAQSIDDMGLPEHLASFSEIPLLVAEYDNLKATQVQELIDRLVSASDDAAIRVWEIGKAEPMYAGSSDKWPGFEPPAPVFKARKAPAKKAPAKAKKPAAKKR